MIYLIDEKKERQNKYGWTTERFQQYKNELIIVSNYVVLQNITSKIILENSNNIVMLHDSFFKNENVEEYDIQKFKNKIESCGLKFITFGGSFDSIYYKDKILQLQVSRFYSNLQLFIENPSKELRILAYGNEFEKEEFLLIKNSVWNFLFRYDDLYRLTADDKFKLLTELKFNKLVTSVLDKCNSVSEIKTILNKWKI